MKFYVDELPFGGDCPFKGMCPDAQSLTRCPANIGRDLSDMEKCEMLCVKKYQKYADVDSVLRHFGVNTHLTGYEIIKDALLIMNKGYKDSTELIYRMIGKERGLQPMAVERNIRYTVETSYKNMPDTIKAELFGNGVGRNKCPTNSQFLSALFYHVK